MARQPCEEAFRRLDDHLDRELSPNEMELVGSDLDGWERCAREFPVEEQALEAVRTKLNTIGMPPELHTRLFDVLDEERNAAGGEP